MDNGCNSTEFWPTISKNFIEEALQKSRTIESPLQYMAGDVGTMSEYAGRIAVGVVLVTVIAVAFAFELNNYLPANSSVTTGSTGIVGSQLPPTGCTAENTRIAEGYRLDLYTSPIVVTAGESVCIYTDFSNVSNQSASFPVSEYVLIRNATAAIFLQSYCAIPADHGVFGQNSSGWACSLTWNTTNGYNGLIATAGTYSLTAYVDYSWEAVPLFTGTFLSVRGTASGANTSTTIRSASTIANGTGAPTCTFLNGQGHVLFPPLQQSGPIYLRVVTTQGTVVTNGTVFATHMLSPSDSLGSADYCMLLASDTNATGYMQVSDSGAVTLGGDGLPLGGAYNFTVRAGYGRSQPLQVAIPEIVVQPNTITYITISVPSGEVTTVTTTCSPGNGCATATTTATPSVGG
jgi:hypothetical protein